ncbi:MAG TPA: HEAT repeat domain-containing protein [Fervidobacterium sp.]|nr:HEAT repeat domain-containing protein [Fervidobacterium sp.]
MNLADWNGSTINENEGDSEQSKREELISRIIEEKGGPTFDDMVRLLEDEDENVRDIATEVLYRLGDKIRDRLEQLVKSKVKNGKKNDTVLLYLIDLVGDIGSQNAVKDLIRAISLYDFEEAQLVIYEALAKLGAGEQFYPLLRYMLLEGEERFMFGGQVAMVMSYLNIPEIVHDFVDAIDSGDFKEEDLEIIKKALSNVINTKPSYKEVLISLVGEENFYGYVQ